MFSEEKTVRAGVSETLSNIWSYVKNHRRLDYELMETRLTLDYGLTPRTTLSVGFFDQRFKSGILDNGVENFHDFFGIDQNGRDQFPVGDLRGYLEDESGNVLLDIDGSDSPSCQAAELALHHRIPVPDELGIRLIGSIFGRLDLHESDVMEKDSPFDLGAALLGSRDLGQFTVYLGMAAAWYGQDKIQQIELRSYGLSGMAAAAWRFLPGQSLILQYRIDQGPAPGLDSFGQASHLLALGWKGRIFSRLIMETSIVENIITYSNSSDIALHLGLAWDF